MDDRCDPRRRQPPVVDPIGRRERPADGDEDLALPLVEDGSGRTMRPPAVVADVRLELVEGLSTRPSRPSTAHRLHAHRADDHVEAARIGDADLQCRQPLLDGAPFLLELAAPALEGGPQVIAAGRQPADLGQRASPTSRRARMRRSSGSWAGE